MSLRTVFTTRATEDRRLEFVAHVLERRTEIRRIADRDVEVLRPEVLIARGSAMDMLTLDAKLAERGYPTLASGARHG